MFLTVFTPTYNRASTLERLYLSLCRQTNTDFYWLIVDDGSTDNTEEVVKLWISENKIRIDYHKQENRGKSMAHNKGVEFADSELFVCVDSDDYLTNDAVEILSKVWTKSCKTDVGILAFKRTEDRIVTKLTSSKKNIRTTLKNAYDNLGLIGDTMLVFKTEIIKKYRFPDIEDEKFVPEAYLYDLIDQDGRLMVIRKSLYVCEYMQDGYTGNMARLLKNNPKGYISYINQRLKVDKSLKEKFFDSIRYIAIAMVVENYNIIGNAVYPIITMAAYPFGILFYLKRYKNA